MTAPAVLTAPGRPLFSVDADGVFTDATIPEMLAASTSPRVGAVCGNDEPVNLDRVPTRLLACSPTAPRTCAARWR